MKTGIIILNYNDYENTLKMVEQIRNYKCLNTIVIVDNASNDGSQEKLRKLEKDHIKLIEAKENKGYAYGNNLGLKYLASETNCELAIISNPDIEVEESTIESMIQDMKKDESISFLGPKVLEFGRIMKGWKLPTYLDEVLSTMNGIARFAKKRLRYKEAYYQNNITKVEVIHGCFFMARIKDFKEIGYFDPHTFLYYEENIIGNKALKRHLTIAVDTSVSVIHALSKSVDKSLNKIKKYKILKNSMFYYETTYNDLRGIKLGFLKLIYYISLGIAYLTFWI
ncbi:MAG: glycosyltransferase family 2 protein [Bacilli bacterium]|nr:glycosyltransferase family 2 protein [Bacilli bacterium]MBR1817909.1 glycosyltransferase family 2 protein [Bacilli bacterium]